ncbi:hypothetical protein G9A89_005986 [Geosiphon pyriformis]|nr:hypothetical protein G9A89_005986 [Geosiphon pyriformis]
MSKSPKLRRNLNKLSSPVSKDTFATKIQEESMGQHNQPYSILGFDHDQFCSMKARLDGKKETFFIKSDSLTSGQLKDILCPHTLLSSDHINAYFSMLNEIHDHIYSLSTYFYTRLVSSDEVYDYSAVTRWTKHTNLFDKELVFIPINLDQVHWILAVINMKDRQIQIWDSLGRTRYKATVGKHLRDYLKDEYKFKKIGENQSAIRSEYGDTKKDGGKPNYHIGNTKKTRLIQINSHSARSQGNIVSSATQSTRGNSTYSNDKLEQDEDDFKVVDKFLRQSGPQSDGTSCGVFVCLIARLLAERQPEEDIQKVIFKDEAADEYRKTMTLELFTFATRDEIVVSGENQFDYESDGFHMIP